MGIHILWFISNDSYDRLKFRIFAWLGLNPDYAPDMLVHNRAKAFMELTND